MQDFRANIFLTLGHGDGAEAFAEGRSQLAGGSQIGLSNDYTDRLHFDLPIWLELRRSAG